MIRMGRHHGLKPKTEHDAFADAPWIIKLTSFIEKVIKHTEKRIVGVCFGHQIVGRAMGARLGRSPEGWEVSVLPFELTDVGREVFGQNQLVSSCQSPPRCMHRI